MTDTQVRRSFTPTTAVTAPQETPKKKVRKPRRGPPGVVCPSCHKLAGSEDDGRVDDLEVSVSGSEDSVEVSVDGATLVLVSACCSEDFKSYDLSGNSKSIDHDCPKLSPRDDALDAWRAHCADECTVEPKCSTDAGSSDECTDGTALKQAYDDLEAEVQNDGETWALEDENPEAEAYQRYQSTARIRKTNKVVPIRSSRYAKSYRGITFSVTAKHELCGETVEIDFEEGDVETEAGAFEALA